MSRGTALLSAVYIASRGVGAAPIAGAVVADAAAPRGVRYVAGAAPADALAWGTYDAAPLFTTGWAVLEVHTPADSTNDTLASYAAGYFEGFSTALELDQFCANTGSDAANSKKLAKFLTDNWEWMAQQVAANTSTYWQQVGSLMAQVRRRRTPPARVVCHGLELHTHERVA